MNNYGKAAARAAKLLGQDQQLSPQEAWKQASTEVFGAGTSSQAKGCPRGAFLGLCSAGLIAGVSPGDYTRSRKNAQYAVDAIAVLRERPELANDPHALWNSVPKDDPDKVPNSQMEVVCALWLGGFVTDEALG